MAQDKSVQELVQDATDGKKVSPSLPTGFSKSVKFKLESAVFDYVVKNAPQAIKDAQSLALQMDTDLAEQDDTGKTSELTDRRITDSVVEGLHLLDGLGEDIELTC
jgi:hypothetical protein